VLNGGSGGCAGFTDHCLNEAFNASCSEGRVVLITEARFGRMRPGRCIGGAFNVGCYKNIKPQLDELCTARSRCDVSVRDLVDLHPCQRDFVSYLEAGYVCVEGICGSMICCGTQYVMALCPSVCLSSYPSAHKLSK